MFLSSSFTTQDFLPIFLISLILVIVLPFILHQVLIQQRPNEPPLHKGWVPYYGVAGEMDRNPEKLLIKLQKKYGDIFTVWTNGGRMTICLDILQTIPNMYRNVKQLEFHEFERQLQVPVFGYPQDYRDSPQLQHEIHELTNVYAISAENVKHLTADFVKAFDKILLGDVKKHEGEFNVDMRDWARYLMYAASCKALFGPYFPSEEEQMFRDFLAWEWDFVNMAKYKPKSMIQKGWDARERIFKRIAKEMAEHEDLVSDFVKQRIKVVLS
jgi:Cytochrome P450